MLIKTHLSITLFLILILISSVENKILFVVVAILATFLADIDSQYSTLGKKKVFRILQFFIRHRTVFHSFIFLFLLTALFVFFLPVIALPFFLGYGSHLIADSFTMRGIRPFYPLKSLAYGKLRTGSKTETSIFLTFLTLDIFLFFMNISVFN
jgi:membrane-bound metal-dependent hydrolase YbcI (DUF457 family)